MKRLGTKPSLFILSGAWGVNRGVLIVTGGIEHVEGSWVFQSYFYRGVVIVRTDMFRSIGVSDAQFQFSL